MAMKQSFITTVDNPYDPYENFKEWYAFDTRMGYNTTAYLSRIVKTSSELSPLDQSQAIDIAIDEIMEYNILGLYRKIEKFVDE